MIKTIKRSSTIAGGRCTLSRDAKSGVIKWPLAADIKQDDRRVSLRRRCPPLCRRRCVRRDSADSTTARVSIPSFPEVAGGPRLPREVAWVRGIRETK
ncbi:hypothetical protein PUN28_017693 [Cardiocondyla obscurior]|uniref:Uncharacterized protein n=1 Tax=Cardiocondyla obscurior TaxID=286306 RepID=A0AAW2EMI7_9HYME